MFPSPFVNLGPSVPPICTLVNSTSSLVLNSNVLVVCSTARFLPALKVTSVPAVTWSGVSLVTPFPAALAVQ